MRYVNRRLVTLIVVTGLILGLGSAVLNISFAQVIGTAANGGGQHCRHGIAHAITTTRDGRLSLPNPAPGHGYLTVGHGRDRTRIHLTIRPREAQAEGEGQHIRLKVECR